MLGSSTKLMLFLLVCIGLLADSRYKVSALRHREFFLRQTEADKGVQADENDKLKSNGFQVRHTLEDQGMLKEKRPFLKEVNKNEVKPEETQKQKKKADDTFKSSKRRVRRGSDPIHNKGQPFS